MEPKTIDDVRASVQLNCYISDARYSGDYGLCTYLLKMREFFRWERGLGFDAELDNDEVGAWLSDRESLWKGLEARDFEPIRIGDRVLDPFDESSINPLLLQQGLVYSGGVGAFGKPHFFLAELEQREQHAEYVLVIAGRELARELSAPPAMTREGSIYIRRESLRRMLWEKYESWRWRRVDNPLGRAFSCYPFETDLPAALERMSSDQMTQVLLHERGESRAGDWLGEAWNEMLLDLAHTPAELAARAVRDHIADCWTTLPAIAQSQRDADLHFFVGNLSAMRKSLFPALRAGYDQWLQIGDYRALRELARHALAHWQSLARAMLALHAAEGSGSATEIHALAHQRAL
jgi:hypothetical protein